MDAHALKLFQRKAIKSKREILNALNDYSFHLVHDEEYPSDAILHKPALIELVHRFMKRVGECDLAYLEKPLASYEIVITNIDISLNSVEYTNITLDDNNDIESSEPLVCDPIICIDARFIPVAEFAQRFSIDVRTVVNWIKDRKIKCAEKRPSGWYVAETQRLPSEENQSGSYIFIGENGDLSTIASLCKRTQVFTAFQLEEQRNLVDTISSDSNNLLIEHKQITNEELASIEHALIQSQDVLFENTLVEVIDEKVVSGFKKNPFLIIKEANILAFISQLNLPEETKGILKSMAQDNCGESLLIETLDKLSLKEKFIAFVNEAMVDTKKGYSPIHSQEVY